MMSFDLAHACGTSVVLGPWCGVRALIQHSVVTFRATSMADTDIDAINDKKTRTISIL